MVDINDIRRKKKELAKMLKQAEQLAGKDSYANYRDRKRDEFVESSLKGRDIGEIPPVADPDRRESCRMDFRKFCEVYQPQIYTMAWSNDHLKVIAKIERAVIEGELFAMAMPRGSGKTSLCESAALWALAYGHRHFVTCVGNDASSAAEMLDSVRDELQYDDTPFAEDFPEICYPIACKDGIEQRKLLYHGKPLKMSMTADQIRLPAITGSVSSGGILRVAGITGRIRGPKRKRKDGSTVRPDFVIIDDPQNDESARSLSQCDTREATIRGAILGLAGPGKKISGVMPCTVIRPFDLADRILNRDLHPEWQGERTKMLYSFPTNETLWERYKEIRESGQRDGSGVEAATKFYRDNQSAMDAGACAAWEARHSTDELSAVQHAMNLFYDRGKHAFFAEYQNEPIVENAGVDDLDPDKLAERCLGIPRCTVPSWATRITAFIDVQQKLLYYAVAAWGEDFSGCLIDYGTYPDQGASYFTHNDARRTLSRMLPGAGEEGAIFSGLEKLTLQLLARDWLRQDGAAMRIELCLVDANWMTDTVYEFCRRSQFSGSVMPRWGQRVTGQGSQWQPQRRPGERAGFKWIVRRAKDRTIPHVFVEVDGWKSFTAARLQTPRGDKGELGFFGSKGSEHRMLIDHLTSETRSRVEGRNGTVDIWTIKPESHGQNHWWDCLVGCAVAASVRGTQFEAVTTPQPTRVRKSMSEMQRERRLANSRRTG